METITIEIRASEGGNDSKLLVKDLASIYEKSCRNNNFSYKTDERDGTVNIWITGNKVSKYFSNESGSHCFVRIPPTEKNGRVQTSFVTVAIMNEEEKSEFKLDRNLVIKNYIRSSKKAGGQNLNKVSSCVQLTHIPTGIQVKIQDTRDQCKNEIIAWDRLTEKLKTIDDKISYDKTRNYRNDQIGNGSRGGTKRRTYRLLDDTVTDHITGKVCRWKDILRGKIELLF